MLFRSMAMRVTRMAMSPASAMEGTYGGYDGPCPPWNDSIVHRYHLTVYALDVPSLDLPLGFDGGALLSAMDGHVLASARHTGTYTLNAELR